MLTQTAVHDRDGEGAKAVLPDALRAISSLGATAGGVSALYATAATLAQRAGELERARDYARTAMTLDPLRAEHAVRLARIHTLAGEFTDAERVLERAMLESPDDPSLLAEMARLQARTGNRDSALALFRQALEREPDAGDCHRDLANLLTAMGDAESALEHAREASRILPTDVGAQSALVHACTSPDAAEAAVLAVDRGLAGAPTSADLHNVLGVALMRCGRGAEAEDAFRRAKALDEHHAEALNNLGVLLAQRADYEGSVRVLEEAVRSRPGYGIAHSNLGHALLNLDHTTDALAHCQLGAFICADTPICHANLGRALTKVGRPREGIEEIDTALQLDPELAAAYLFRAFAHHELEDHASAIRDCKRAVRCDPDYLSAWSFLAHVARTVADLPSVREAYEALNRLTPDSPDVKYFSAILEKDDIDRCEADYVRAVFDAYAERFDKHLTEQLEYRAPELARKFVQSLQELPSGPVLDLGCGTGLCGPWLRETASRLEGVDISGEMLDVARKRGVYDRLTRADILEFLATQEARYDLITCIDVIPYFGDLGRLFLGTASAMSSGGHFVFTTEAADQGTFTVQLNGRWRHARPYVLRVMEEVGLTSVKVDQFAGRKELRQDVLMDIYAARKS